MKELKKVKIESVDDINLEEISCVYFIKNSKNNLIKIGKTKDLARRYIEICNQARFLGINDLSFTVLGIIECINISEVESVLHNEFKQYRVQNEWFDIEEELLFNAIESMEINISHDKQKCNTNEVFLPSIKLNVMELNDSRYFGNNYKVELIGMVNDETFEIMVGLTGYDNNIVHCFDIEGCNPTIFMYAEILDKINKREYTNHYTK